MNEKLLPSETRKTPVALKAKVISLLKKLQGRNATWTSKRTERIAEEAIRRAQQDPKKTVMEMARELFNRERNKRIKIKPSKPISKGSVREAGALGHREAVRKGLRRKTS